MRGLRHVHLFGVLVASVVVLTAVPGANAGENWQWSITPHMWATDISEDLIVDGEIVGLGVRFGF